MGKHLLRQKYFPSGTIVHENIPCRRYSGKTSARYLCSEKAKATMPLIIWIHGGAWMLVDKRTI
jgi:acetyl esterase/lipase